MKALINPRAAGICLGLVLIVFALAGASQAGSKVSEETAWLGVQLQALNDDLKEAMGMDEGREGVLIAEVLDDSPADNAGIEDGDVVTAINGEAMTSVEQLVAAIRDRSPGDKVEIEVLRDGRSRSFDVELGRSDREREIKKIRMPDLSRLEALGERANEWVQTWDDGRGYLGVSILDLNDDLGQYFKVKEGEGVLITQVHEDSPAEEAGLLAGDVVLEFDGKMVKSTDKFRKYVAGSDPGEDVTLVVKRKGRQKTFEVEIGEMESPMGHFMGNYMRANPRGAGRGKIVIRGDDGDVKIIDLPDGTGPQSCVPGTGMHKFYIGDQEGLDDLDEVVEFQMQGDREDLDDLEQEIKDLQKEMEELRKEMERLKK